MRYAYDAIIDGKKLVVLDMLDLVFNVRSPPHSQEMLVGLSKNMGGGLNLGHLFMYVLSCFLKSDFHDDIWVYIDLHVQNTYPFDSRDFESIDSRIKSGASPARHFQKSCVSGRTLKVTDF